MEKHTQNNTKFINDLVLFASHLLGNTVHKNNGVIVKILYFFLF